MSWILRERSTKDVYQIKHGSKMGRSLGDFTFPNIKSLSSTHCEFFVEGSELFIMDLHSTNGILIEGQRIKAGEKVKVEQGKVLNIGGFLCEAEFLEVKDVQEEVFIYEEKFSELSGLGLKNTIFIILSLGLYLPFAKTHMRKYLWKSVKFKGHSFSFEGDGLMLLISYVKFILFMGAGTWGLWALENYNTSVPWVWALGVIQSLLLMLILYKMAYGGDAYLVNNTSYRNTPFSLTTTAANLHFKESLTGVVKMILTLGLYYPFWKLRLLKIKWNHTKFGHQEFVYSGESLKYGMLWYKGVALTALTLGLYYPWYMASLHRFHVSHLKLRNAEFSTTIKGSGLFEIYLKILMINILTLGLGFFYTKTLLMAYHFKFLGLKGEVKIEETGLREERSLGAMKDAMVDLGDAA